MSRIRKVVSGLVVQSSDHRDPSKMIERAQMNNKPLWKVVDGRDKKIKLQS